MTGRSFRKSTDMEKNYISLPTGIEALILFEVDNAKEYSRKDADDTALIKITPCYHKGEKRLRLEFHYDRALIDRIRTIPGCRWSDTMHCWHVPDNPKSKGHILRLGLCKSESMLKSTQLMSCIEMPVDLRTYFEKFGSYLTYKRYSKNTIRVYLSMMKIFFWHFKYCSPDLITYDDIIVFNNEYILGNNFSYNYQNQMISAIKSFFEQVEHRKINIENIQRPRRPKSLPVVLSKREVADLIKATGNLKHKAILSLIYSAGLRIGEAIHMKLTDIDPQRGLIHIRNAKGQKDRMVNLSPQLLFILRNYARKYKPREYLFNGQDSLKYTASSIRKILHSSGKKAGIKKAIRVHTLRHSFATHMLEKGVDIRYIQEMLGHRDPKTTMIYTHVSERKINTFVNPLDELHL